MSTRRESDEDPFRAALRNKSANAEVCPPSLRLWLPGYHTPSLNVTTGQHWKVYLGLKQKAARALCDALRGQGLEKVEMVLDAIAKGGRSGQRGALIRGAAKQEAALAKTEAQNRGGVGVGGRERVSLTYTRVTCQPLDVENFCGSTKALTDCLRYAFPGLLPDDAPEFVEIRHLQERCAKRCEQGTWVEITPSGVASHR